jgi:hypothetical protein
MPEEQEPDNPEDDQQSEQEEEQEQEQQEDTPEHTCGAKLEKGMKYCPGCGDPVDTSAYK